MTPLEILALATIPAAFVALVVADHELAAGLFATVAILAAVTYFGLWADLYPYEWNP